MLSVDKIKRILEAALLAARQPLSLERMGTLFTDGQRPSRGTLRTVLGELAGDCAERGIELTEVASGYRFQVRRELAPWVARLWEERPPRYSRALLETLVLIAYRQPITRAEIEEVRGVAVSTNIIRTLQERQWIRALGHREVPGRPAIYGTTRQFLDYFNLESLDQLPTLAEVRDLDQVAEGLQRSLELEVIEGGGGEPGDRQDPRQPD
jgi:segregation and condensation protein B